MTRICEANDLTTLDSIWKDFGQSGYRNIIWWISSVSFILGVSMGFANPDLTLFGITICGATILCLLALRLSVVNPSKLLIIASFGVNMGAIFILMSLPDWTDFSIKIFELVVAYPCVIGLVAIYPWVLIGRRRNEIVGAVNND